MKIIKLLAFHLEGTQHSLLLIYCPGRNRTIKLARYAYSSVHNVDAMQMLAGSNAHMLDSLLGHRVNEFLGDVHAGFLALLRNWI
jgi:hypothetical protein